MSRPRILIVDDDPDILEVLGDRLAAQGYQIETARDGLAALEAIRADAPDLAILDLMMPRMGGMEVLRKIQEEGLDVTAMVVTAAGSVQRAVEAMKTGASRWRSWWARRWSARGCAGATGFSARSCASGPRA
jgi:DNA-binding response OmpR family regulator